MRKITIFSLFLLLGIFQVQSQTINLRVRNLNSIKMCDQFPGATAGDKIAACLADLPSTGGIADATSLQGNQTISTNVFSGITKQNVVLKLGPGTYTLTTPIIVTADRTHIIGGGQRVSIIKFAPTSTNQCAITFKNPGSTTIAQNSISGIGFDATGNTQDGKIALCLTDAEEPIVSNISIGNWTSTSKNAVGIGFKGRQLMDVHDLTINADLPISIDVNPNSYLSSDHFHLYNLYLTADNSQPCINMADSITVQNLTIDGFFSCNLGNRAIYWNSTTDVNASININISNLRWEQSTSGLHGIYISRLAPIYGLTIANTRFGNLTDVKGTYLRNIRGGKFTANVYAGTTESLNIDNTVQAMVFDGNNFTPGGASTISSTGWSDGVWIGNNQGTAARIGIGVISPSGALAVGNNVCISAVTVGGVEKCIVYLNTSGRIIIDSSSVGTTIEGPLTIASTELPTSAKVTIANAQCYGAENSGTTDSLCLVNGTAGNHVGLDSQGHDTDVGGSLNLGTATSVPAALINMASSTKGLLMPRMTKANMDAITKPDGLQLYCTDCNKNTNPCTGGGSGSVVFVVNGSNQCVGP